MAYEPTRAQDPAIRALIRDIAEARDPQIMRIVAMVDAMTSRGPADQLVAPLRQRLAHLRPPRPLRFRRLIFYPLDLLIVPAARWRRGHLAIPRTATVPMAEHIRLALGRGAATIEAEISGRTTADTGLIARVGQSLWPAAADILASSSTPKTWDATGLGDAVYRALADTVATLLAEAAALDTLCAECATGLLPPPPEVVDPILRRVAEKNSSVLPMMIALLLDRLPEAAGVLTRGHVGHDPAAMDEAADLLLRQLDREEGTDIRIAGGALADAGSVVSRIARLLQHLDAPDAKPQRRERLLAVRRRLDASCRARFTAGLQDEFLTPLRDLGIVPDPAAIPALESTARGLRVLETEARAVGSGPTYDLLLGQAAEAIKSGTMRNRLALTDQVRLVEILAGSDAALAMLDSPH